MTSYLRWWLLMAVCMLAAAVLVPLCAAVVGVTKLVMAALDYADEQLLAQRLRRPR